MFAKLTAISNSRKCVSATSFPAIFANGLLGTLGGWIVLQLLNPSAIALEAPSAETLETFTASNAPNGILCITACNEFFEAGQASFESEIQRLQRSAARPEESVPILQVDPSLLETSAEQREAESRQPR